MLNLKLRTPNGTLQQTYNQQVKDAIFEAPIVVQGSEGSESIALFHRQEIEVGALVGSGSFSDVYEITGFELEKMKKKSSKNGKSIDASMEPARRRTRQDLIEAPKSHYVLKQLQENLMKDPTLFRRAVKDLATEVIIMSSVDHPHIAKVHATALGGVEVMNKGGRHDSYFLVLDRLVQTLDDRIESWNEEKKRIGTSYYFKLDNECENPKMLLKANYALQIASALKYLHQNRIIFRDLKPQNVGFKEVHPGNPERDVLALFDFGLSRKMPSPDQANSDGLYHMSMVGTRRYMAPEVVVSKLYDERADTYGWSLLFYELVTQTRPFDGINRVEHKHFICIEGQRPQIHVYHWMTPALERLMRSAWAQDPKKRPSMGQVCETLETYLTGTIHEGCVQQPEKSAAAMDENTKAAMDENTFSSNFSVSTQKTVQTSSTRSSSADDGKQGRHEASKTDAAVGVDAVPQAFALSLRSSVSSRLTEQSDCPRSTCKRLAKVFKRVFRHARE